MFGREMGERASLVEEGIEVLRAAWSGAEFQYRGRKIRVTPRPGRPQGPALLMGGSTRAAARRAARLGDGFIPVDSSVWPAYEEACRELGRDAGPAPDLGGPLFLHVADDPDRAWAKIAPHALHESNSYGAWLAGAEGVARYTPSDDAESLRSGGDYAVVTPDECVAMVRKSGQLRLHPLMGGLPPDLAWESLELIGSNVLPRLDEASSELQDPA